MKIYVASSYRSKYFDDVVKTLEDDGHHVYNFKKPWGAAVGFEWKEIDPNWQEWETNRYLMNLYSNPRCEAGFNRDKQAIDWADCLLLLRPCGSSAHTEFGYAVGSGKKTAVLIMERQEPELMLRFANYITDDFKRLRRWLVDQKLPICTPLAPESRL